MKNLLKFLPLIAKAIFYLLLSILPIPILQVIINDFVENVFITRFIVLLLLVLISYYLFWDKEQTKKKNYLVCTIFFIIGFFLSIFFMLTCLC